MPSHRSCEININSVKNTQRHQHSTKNFTHLRETSCHPLTNPTIPRTVSLIPPTHPHKSPARSRHALSLPHRTLSVLPDNSHIAPNPHTSRQTLIQCHASQTTKPLLSSPSQSLVTPPLHHALNLPAKLSCLS